MLTASSLAASTKFGAPISRAIAVDGSAKALPRPSIVMLWGTWCASCAAEIKRVPDLARVAAPTPFVTLAIDPAERARRGIVAAGLPTATAFADGRDPAVVLADWGGGAAALPLAVAIDRRGRICASKRGLLGTDQIREWKSRCSR